MEQIQFICSRLNAPPFNQSLRLVDFDEKSPVDLLQSLTDSFSHLDSSTPVNVRDENPDLRSQRILSFLTMLNCPLLQTAGSPPAANGNQPAASPEERQRFADALAAGHKKAVYPTFEWLLLNFDKLQKRAYLGKFLVRVEPPQDFMQDESVRDMVERLKELQSEFKDVHKSYETSKLTMSRPSAELKQELTQLESERRQLKERIEKLKAQTSSSPLFPAMLNATSALRQEQDEELRLQDRSREQQHLRALAEQRHSDVSRRLNQLQSAARAAGGNTAESLLAELQKDVAATARVVRVELGAERARLSGQLATLERQRLEPARTTADLDRIRAQVRQSERQRDDLRESIDRAVHSNGQDGKLAMFRQHASLAASKLSQKEDEVERRAKDLAAARQDVDDLEGRVGDLAASAGGGIIGPNGRAMSKDDFKAYGQALRDKTIKYKACKAELATLRAESVVLNRTEQILKGRDRNLEEFLKQEEARAGVTGFRDAQSRLEAASEQTAELDDLKGQTLDEISDLVRTITNKLEDKKVQLKPLIKELKDVRKGFQEAEQAYQEKKARYDSVSVGLATERSMLEQECDELQDECLREESRYHYLNSMNGITAANLEKVQLEEKWQAGNGKLLPEFKGFTDLYQNKIAQQENLSKALRKQQKRIKENEGGNMYQRSLYADLHQLLSLKMKSRGVGGTGGGMGGYNSILGLSGELARDTVDFGTAQVVRID